MRKTGIKILEYYENELHRKGLVLADFAKANGLKLSTFSWWRNHPELSPKVDTLCDMADFIGSSPNDIIGWDDGRDGALPTDIKEMVSMLLCISMDDRVMLSLNIKNYYDREQEKKKVSSPSAG